MYLWVFLVNKVMILNDNALRRYFACKILSVSLFINSTTHWLSHYILDLSIFLAFLKFGLQELFTLFEKQITFL